VPAKDPSGPVLVFVGPPGAGKSSVGRNVAQRLGLELRDTDEQVAQLAGMSVADIFVELGEPAFREWERLAVAEGLAEHAGVLALGGGAIMDRGIRDALGGRPVVYLQVGLADAMRRVGLTRDRPLLVGNVRGRWLVQMEERRPLYEQVARWTVATDGRTAAEVAEEVLAVTAEAP
jgi:shikimate kinase